MKTLEEHNRERREIRGNQDGRAQSTPRPNNIACPDCGWELFDSNPHELLTSNPPQKNIECHNCAYKGRRIA